MGPRLWVYILHQESECHQGAATIGAMIALASFCSEPDSIKCRTGTVPVALEGLLLPTTVL